MRLKIFVVDDDEVFLMIHTSLLRKCDISETKSFLNGKELLDYLDDNNNQNEKYLIFLDLNMPVMNGWEFLEVTKDNFNLFVVIVTSSINIADKEKVVLYKNVIAFIEKPMKKEDCNRIKELPSVEIYFQ